MPLSLSSTLGLSDDVDRGGRRDVVAGPQVLRRANDAQEGVHLGPGVALGEPATHALSLHQNPAASQKSSKTMETNIRQKCGNKGVA